MFLCKIFEQVEKKSSEHVDFVYGCGKQGTVMHKEVEKALRLEKVSRLGRKSADSFPVNLIAQIFNIPRTLPTFGKAFNK